MMKVILDQEAIDAIELQINGNGGHQSLMRKLLSQFESPYLSYDADDLERLERYANDYGLGGYQGRFKKILSCIKK